MKKQLRSLLAAAALMGGWIALPAGADNIHIPMRGIDAGTYYVEVGVARLGRVDFLVDTGSGYSTIDETMLADVQRTGDATFVKRLEGIMADGSRMVVPVYRISEIRLGSCLLRDVEVAVFADGTRPILGMRALTRVSPFTFSTDPPAINFSRCDAVTTADAGPPEGQAPQALREAG